ncbi:MAG: glycosyltransferase family 39 protein [Nostocaceae cyanobacterium]|nr:glycosyltransferase family 39 protein [Nostocaceae cyanobacterium]
MLKNRRFNLHYLALAGVIFLGTILRFGNLDLKPLWLDEIITAVFSLGRNFNDLPLNVVLPLGSLHNIFTYQPGVSCSQIAANVATQSTHPPLFFCWMYTWLGWMTPLGENWVIKLRSLAAVSGVSAIAAIYGVGRSAFSQRTGLVAALLMAVSPFTVYLSQEARHYTLPMLLITLSLLGLVQIQQDIQRQQKLRVWVWLAWIIINIIGIYVHYFCILAFIAEISTLFLILYWHRNKIINQRQILLLLFISITTVTISFVPWFLVMFSHAQRNETDWIGLANYIAPFYQTLIGWLVMLIFLPVENQPLPIAITSGLLMVIFGIWLGRQVFKGLKHLWQASQTHLATFTIISFYGFVLLEFLIIVYLLNKDITAIPRYNFIYYPSVCILIAASCSQNKKSILTLLFVGILSSVLVINNLGFKKPFQPDIVVQNINQEPSLPLMVIMAYRDYQDIALGWSFALALEKIRMETDKEIKIPNSSDSHFAFFPQSPNIQSVWKQLSLLPTPKESQLNLWVVAPGIRRREYPQKLAVSPRLNCTIDTTQHYRIGVPYQLYRCGDLGKS